MRVIPRGDRRIDAHVRNYVLPMDYPAEAEKESDTAWQALPGAGNTLHLVLCRKMGVRLQSLEVELRAERSAEHPTVLTEIELKYCLRGEALCAEQIEKAGRIDKDQLCPVLAMLRPGTRITSSWRMDSSANVELDPNTRETSLIRG